MARVDGDTVGPEDVGDLCDDGRSRGFDAVRLAHRVDVVARQLEQGWRRGKRVKEKRRGGTSQLS